MINEFYYNSNLFFSQQAIRANYYRHFADPKYCHLFAQYKHLHESQAPTHQRVMPLLAMSDSLGQLLAVDIVSRKLYNFISDPVARDLMKIASAVYERWMNGESIQEISRFMNIPPTYVKRALKMAKEVRTLPEAAVDRVRALLEEGKTVKEIIEITGLSETIVYETIHLIQGPNRKRIIRSKITEDMIKRIKKLRSEGIKPEEIAEMLGIGRTTVYKVLQRERRKLVTDLKGKNRRYRKLTDEDKAIIQSMRLLGASLTEIANQFGCGPSTIHYYLQRLSRGREVMYYA